MASEYLEKFRRPLRLACADVAKCDPVAPECSATDCPLSKICPRWVPAWTAPLSVIHRAE